MVKLFFQFFTTFSWKCKIINTPSIVVVVFTVVVDDAVVCFAPVTDTIFLNSKSSGGQDWPQYPQLPIPAECSIFSLTFVEHQYLSSGSVSVIHSFLNIP